MVFGHWAAGAPTCYLAKYSSGGALQWAVSFGPQNQGDYFMDLEVDTTSGYFCGYDGGGYTRIAHFISGGSNDWDVVLNQQLGAYSQAVKLGGITPSNCCFTDFRNAAPGYSGRFDLAENPLYFPQPLVWTDSEINGKPVIDSHRAMFRVGFCYGDCGTAQVLRKFDPTGSTVWNVPVGTEEQYVVAGDKQDFVYLAGVNGLFSKYDTDGTLIWSTNYGKQCLRMVVDAVGNRFLDFSDNSIARLAADPPAQPPVFSSGPQSQTHFVGDNVALSSSANGTPPLHYQWRQNGTNVLNGTGATLNFSSVPVSNAGLYTVVVTNAAGAVTSSPPALLRVKLVELYLGSQLLTNGTYEFSSPPTLTIRSAFANGSSFYTLDGSIPGFGSTFYSGPFTLSQSATVRAVGYSSDFFESEEADAINAIVLVNHTLTVVASAGGTVNLNPSGGTYINTNVVMATAAPSAGSTFLYWLGDASGTNPAVNISMERDKTIQAIFGTTLTTTVAGNGQVLLYPTGGVYAYGTIVRLSGVPQPGNYFGFWGNAGTGNTNPLFFTISSPTQTVSSIFGVATSDQAALTVLINGHGRVNVSPRANIYTTNQSIMLTATADPGQTFVNWSGDASGTQSPISVAMTQSRVVTAHFTSQPVLRVNQAGLEGMTADGFRITVLGDPQLSWQIQGSTNLSGWVNLGTVTNSFGEVQFTDPAADNFPSRSYRAAPSP
jgi:hypothetical protein